MLVSLPNQELLFLAFRRLGGNKYVDGDNIVPMVSFTSMVS
jgi:hypothetical protein